MNNERKPILPVFVGPPGVGKTTISEIICALPQRGIRALDGDSFISLEGIARLQANTWDDTDRVTYLANMARGAVAEIQSGQKIILFDAMTTRWMRQFFACKVASCADVEVKWIEVRRHFHDNEIEALIEQRRLVGHPINSRVVFERFTSQFEPVDAPRQVLINPGANKPVAVLEDRVCRLIDKLYGHTI